MMIKSTILALSFALTLLSDSVFVSATRNPASSRRCKAPTKIQVRPVIPRNDWKKPCFGGECSYDSNKGSVKIWGSPAAIADITEAGGWEILNCDPNELDQDIRLVCAKPEGCEKLFNTVDPKTKLQVDPVGKLVRLPESCGRGAFARVAKVWTHENQRIPTKVRRKLVRRDGETTDPIVRGITLDTDFAKIDVATTGEVYISIQGTNVPGIANANANTTTAATSSTGALDQRGFFDFIEKAFNKFNKFNHNTTTKLPPLDIDEKFTLLDASIDCPAVGNIPAIKAGVKADVGAKAHAVVSIGLAAEGTIIPPKLSTFGVFAGLDADFRGTLDLRGSATGTIDTGKVTFFQQGIPGLDFPGLLTLGPSFKIQGQALATLDVGVDMQVDLAYSVKDAKLFFPKSANPSGGGFSSSDSPLQLSVTPSVSAKGTVEAHLIPVLDLGVTALGGLAKATIFLNLDASADLTLTLEGKANAGVSVPIAGAGAVVKAGVRAAAGVAAAAAAAQRPTISPSISAIPSPSLAKPDVAVAHTTATAPVAPTSASASISGCVEIGGGLDVNAGADASFFGLFDKSTSISLFSKDFEFFKKCFEASALTPNTSAPPPPSSNNLVLSKSNTLAKAPILAPKLSKRIDIVCPTTADFTKLVTVANEKLAGQTRRRSIAKAI